MDPTYEQTGWVYYFFYEADRLAHVAFDLSIAEEVPFASLPFVTRLRCPFQEGPHGLVVDPEDDRLDEIAYAFHDFANQSESASLRARCAGRKTRAGIRDYYFYTSREISREWCDELALKLSEIGNVEIGWDRDESWSEYRTLLHPGAAMDVLLASWQQIERRAKNGDRADVERDVDHILQFPDDARREAFLKTIEDPEWRVRCVENSGAVVTIQHPTGRMTLDIYIIALTSRIEPYQGRYAAWGAPMCRGAR